MLFFAKLHIYFNHTTKNHILSLYVKKNRQPLVYFDKTIYIR